MSQTIANLPIGAKIKLGKYSVNGESASPIIWLKAGSYRTLQNSVTLITERIIDLRPYDATETQSDMYNPKNYGNTDYSLSNIDQWLNKDNNSGEWFSKTHAYDESPTATNTQFNTPYTNRPAFLNGFTAGEKDILLNTPVELLSKTIYRKVFLLGVPDILPSEATALELFKNNNSAQAFITQQCLSNTTCQIKPSSTASAWGWLTSSYDNSNIHIILESGVGTTVTQPRAGQYGVRPALNVSNTTLVSDITDNDGCYTILYNQAPPTPTNLRALTEVFANKPITIAWDEVIDPDGDVVRYRLTRKIVYDELNISEEQTIYEGTDTSFIHTVPDAMSIIYTIRATDSINESSGMVVSYDIQQNNPPTISGTDTNLGVKTDGFTQKYVVDDVDGNRVTVGEMIDLIPIRTYNATLGEENTFDVTNEQWLRLSNGSHEMLILAQDDTGDSVSRRYNFTKNVTSFSVKTSPIVAATKPTRISLTIGRSIPTGATFKVEVCNNGFDTNPTWEDCTSAVISNLVHSFSNDNKTASSWGVVIRITVARNGDSGSCYVDTIGGNFE